MKHPCLAKALFKTHHELFWLNSKVKGLPGLGDICSEGTLAAKHITGDLASWVRTGQPEKSLQDRKKGKSKWGEPTWAASPQVCREIRVKLKKVRLLPDIRQGGGQGSEVHQVRLVAAFLPWHTLPVSSWATHWRTHLTHLHPAAVQVPSLLADWVCSQQEEPSTAQPKMGGLNCPVCSQNTKEAWDSTCNSEKANFW